MKLYIAIGLLGENGVDMKGNAAKFCGGTLDDRIIK